METMEQAFAEDVRASGAFAFANQQDDPLMGISRTQLCQVAYLAAETATRFEREGGSIDAMDWMLSPRALFRGRTPLEAALTSGDMLKGIIFHRLAKALDGAPEPLDELLASVGPDPEPRSARSEQPSSGLATPRPGRLYTAVSRFERQGVAMGLIYVTKANSADDVLADLQVRLGSDPHRQVVVSAGFRHLADQARTILPAPMFDLLLSMEDREHSIGQFSLLLERELGH